MLNREQTITEIDKLTSWLNEKLSVADSQPNYAYHHVYSEYSTVLSRIKYFLATYDQTKVYVDAANQHEAYVRDKEYGHNVQRKKLLEGYIGILNGFKESLLLYS